LKFMFEEITFSFVGEFQGHMSIRTLHKSHDIKVLGIIKII